MTSSLVEARMEPAAFDPTDERAVVGCLIINPAEALPLVADQLSPSLFFDHVAKVGFQAVTDLYADGREINPLTITQRLRDTNRLREIGGAHAVSELAEERHCSSLYGLERDVQRLRDHSAARLALRFGHKLTELAQGQFIDAEAIASAIEENAAAVRALQYEGAQARKPKVEFLRPSQIRAFVAPEGWNFIGDHHVQRGSPFVIGGAPGVGKSRTATALAVAGATGADWFGLPVHRRFRTMILQAENGPIRLRDEYAGLDTDEIDEAVRVCPPPPYGFRFNDPGFCRELTAAIAEFGPDVFIIDPWNRATADDKSKDYLETFTRLLAMLPTGDKAPALGVVAHTRKPSVGERTNGRGLLNILAGGYALGSVPRSAFVVQHASDDPEEARVVFTCCKNNDGELGPRTAWVRGNGLFQAVTDFDWKEFDHPGEKRRVITAEDIEAVFALEEGESGYQLLTKKQAVARLEEHTGCKRTACYDALTVGGKVGAHLKEKSGLLTLK